MLEKTEADLKALSAQRAEVSAAGWSLQNCWLTQSKPGGTARTNHKYWQVRSRQPMFDGKTVKHLKADEVDDYRAAIERGRQIQQIDSQIKKLQQQLTQVAATETATDVGTDAATKFAPKDVPNHTPSSAIGLQSPLHKSLPQKELPPLIAFTNLAEQEQVVRDILDRTRALRESLHRAGAHNRLIRSSQTRKPTT